MLPGSEPSSALGKVRCVGLGGVALANPLLDLLSVVAPSAQAAGNGAGVVLEQKTGWVEGVPIPG